MTYVTGGSLSPAQMAAMAAEKEPGGPPRDQLLAALDAAFANAEAVLRTIDPATLANRAPSAANNCPRR